MTTIREKNAEKFRNRLLTDKKGKYSLIGEYKTARDKALIRHNVCGYEWYTKPVNILNAKGLQGCPKCQYDSKSYSTEEFKEVLKHKFNGMFVMQEGTEYNRENGPLYLTHLKCGNDFETYWGTFSMNGACPYCKKPSKKRMTNDEFLSRVSKAFSDEYEILTEYSLALEDITIKHRICGKIWKVRASHIMYDGRGGCPFCNMSYGEYTVQRCLENLNIKFINQKKFDGCKNKHRLPFDFYLPELNAIIEYDGEQHFHAVDYFGGESQYKYQVNNDNIKNKFCEANHIKLLRIDYTHTSYDDILNIISNFI